MENRTVRTDLLLPADLPEEIRDALSESPEEAYHHDGYLYILRGETVLRCEDNPEGNQLVRSVLSPGNEKRGPVRTAADLYYRLLNRTGPYTEGELLKKFRIRDRMQRRVMLFRTSALLEKDLLSLFAEMAAPDENDAAVAIDSETVALIKDVSAQSDEEIREYALAVAGTMEREGISGIVAGIGRIAANAEELSFSYRDALQALRLGKRYRKDETVLEYEQLALERIIDLIPAAKQQKIREQFLGSQTGRGLSDELLETVQVFFRNDLNITAASRQLFIHRNTLNYRLDKIKKITGLDLRTFPDAAVFRIILAIPEEP